MHGLEVGEKKTKFMNLKKKIEIGQEIPTNMRFMETNEYVYLGSEIGPRHRFKQKMREFAKIYQEVRSKWNRTLAINDLDTLKLAYRSYFFAKVAHKVIPILFMSEDPKKNLDDLYENEVKSMKKYRLYSQVFPKDIFGPLDSTYLEERNILEFLEKATLEFVRSDLKNISEDSKIY